MAKSKSKSSARIVVKKRSDGSVIYRLDRDKREGEYFLNEDSQQRKCVASFKMEGFATFPKVLYPSGYGFRVCGNQLLKALHDKFGNRLKLTLSADKPTVIQKKGRVVHLVLNEQSLRQVNSLVSDVKRTRAREINGLVYSFLVTQLPKIFKGTVDTSFKYRPNKIAELLEDREVRELLSDDDKAAIKNLYPDLIAEMDFTLRAASKVKFISDNIKTSKRVYLERIITEFETKLAASSSESAWQRFLHDHILMLLNTYAYVIQKQSVELAGKYPDFMLVDAYGYMDVYEIKKPQTKILKRDQGRNNYFWDVELAKAITQTEKYISSVERNRFDLENAFRKRGVDVSIVRPRGFIIAGNRADLDAEMQEDLRVLNDSLKNIDVICFDDLLDNLKSLLERLTSETESNS